MAQVAETVTLDPVSEKISTHGGDARAAIRALLDRNAALSLDLDRCLEAVSEGFVRGRPKR
jgi:hypothetical protein